METQTIILLVLTLGIFIIGAVMYIKQQSDKSKNIINNLPIILAPHTSHITFNDIPVTLTEKGVPIRLEGSTVLSGIGINKITVLVFSEDNNMIKLGRIKPSKISMETHPMDVVIPSGDYLKLSNPHITYTLKYLTPIQI